MQYVFCTYKAILNGNIKWNDLLSYIVIIADIDISIK